jgi:hypothetical protein
MRIRLLLDDPCPASDRTRSRIAEARELARRGHDVSVLVDPRVEGLPPGIEGLASSRLDDASLAAALRSSDVVVATSAGSLTRARAVAPGAGHAALAVLCDSAKTASAACVHADALTLAMTTTRELAAKVADRAPTLSVRVLGSWLEVPDAPRTGQRPFGTPIRIAIGDPGDAESTPDEATALAACGLARRAGLDLELVRIRRSAVAAKASGAAPAAIEDRVATHPRALSAALADVDLYLGPARTGDRRPCPLAATAMALGIPTVLADSACHRGFGDPCHSIFFEPGSAGQAAEALVLVASNPRIRGELRAAGLTAVAPMMRLDAFVERLETALGTASSTRRLRADARRDAPPLFRSTNR